MRCPRCGSFLVHETETGFARFECNFVMKDGQEIKNALRPSACKVIALLRAQRDELEETVRLLDRRWAAAFPKSQTDREELADQIVVDAATVRANNPHLFGVHVPHED